MMGLLKKTLFALYIIVLVCMGGATIVEKYHGTGYVAGHIYGSWWFSVLWALLAAAAIFYFIKMKVRRCSVVALHLSFVVILAGALVTHVSSKSGRVHLRLGETVGTYMEMGKNDSIVEHKLPFKLRLDAFDIKYHEGTEAESDYESVFTVIDGDETLKGRVSMNNIYSYRSVRLYQSSYDGDRRGSVLSMNSDPYGIPVTYTGYALLFISLVWMLLDPKGAYRRLLRSDMFRRGAMFLVAVIALSSVAKAAPVLPEETAAKFGELNILYNNRVCPLQTYAIDFTKKLYGKAGYKGYTPEQVLTGFIFWGEEWSREPILKVKSGAMRDAMQLPEYCTVNSFFNDMMGGYIIGPYIQEFYQGQDDAFHKQVADVDSRLMMVMELRRGIPLKIFPFTSGGKTTWYSPTDNVTDTTVDTLHRHYMQNVFSLLYQEVLAGNYGTVNQIVDKMQKYQVKNAGRSLPSDLQVKAERLYNAVPFATILFIVNLTLGLLMMLFMAASLPKRRLPPCPPEGGREVLMPIKNQQTVSQIKPHPSSLPPSGGQGGSSSGQGGLVPANEKSKTSILSKAASILTNPLRGAGGLSFLALTLCLALRWIISGTVPMANGYETMLLMAWLIMLVALLMYRRFRIILAFGFLMSGFFLLVSHIGQMSPQITHIMPVLSSPLLSMHVSVIMMSFALLSFTFICGLTAIAVRLTGRGHSDERIDNIARLRLLSELFLYPALTTLGFGIFIGAIWANVSWGNYWSWDAKEVWALITFMIYAVAVHRGSVPFLRRDMGYHVFITLAFLSIVMTYFGVNYFLGGMHSYA